MAEILTSSQMKSLEAAAIGSGRVSGLELMERAGRAVVQAIAATWPGARAALILCGPGNNGGDGYVVARILRAQGWQVATCRLRPAALLPSDAATNALRAEAAGVPELPWQAGSICGWLAQAGPGAVVVDALLGIGQSRDSTALLAPWTAAAAALPVQPVRVSIDIPTGYDSDTGKPCAETPFAADLVVTFHAEKPVHAGLRQTGARIVVADIGLPHGPAAQDPTHDRQTEEQ